MISVVCSILPAIPTSKMCKSFTDGPLSVHSVLKPFQYYFLYTIIFRIKHLFTYRIIHMIFAESLSRSFDNHTSLYYAIIYN